MNKADYGKYTYIILNHDKLNMRKFKQPVLMIYFKQSTKQIFVET